MFLMAVVLVGCSAPRDDDAASEKRPPGDPASETSVVAIDDERRLPDGFLDAKLIPDYKGLTVGELTRRVAGNSMNLCGAWGKSLDLDGSPVTDSYGLRCDFPAYNVLFRFTYYERTGQAKMAAYFESGMAMTIPVLDALSETEAERKVRIAAEEKRKAEQEVERKTNAIREVRRGQLAEAKENTQAASRELSSCINSWNYDRHMARSGSSRDQDDLFSANSVLYTENKRLYTEIATFGYDNAAAVERVKNDLEGLAARAKELQTECESRVRRFLAAKAQGERIDAERIQYAQAMASRYDDITKEIGTIMQDMPRIAANDLRVWRTFAKRRRDLYRRMLSQNTQVRKGVEVVGESEHEALRVEYEKIIADLESLRAELVEPQAL